MHEVVAEEYRNLESVNYELVTYTPADWVCLFGVRFCPAGIRQRSPQVTGSLHTLLSRVPSNVLASVALCVDNDYVLDHPLSLESAPSRIGSSAWFLSCVVWVCLGIAEGKATLVWSASLDARPLALATLLTLAPLQNVRSRKLFFL